MLIDTHILVWTLEGVPGQMGSETVRLLQKQANDTVISAASLLEIRVKQRRGGLLFIDVPKLAQRIADSGQSLLPVTAKHCARLPVHDGVGYADPFDLLLIAQAIIEGVPLLTCDHILLDLILPSLKLIDGRL